MLKGPATSELLQPIRPLADTYLQTAKLGIFVCESVSLFHGMAKMSQELDHKLDCPSCKTIYLKIPIDVSGHTPINCTSCGEYLGSWGELEADFSRQGGMNGAFRLDKGKFTRIDQDTMHVHELAGGGPEELRVALTASEPE